jgi:hypothetical protein
MTNRHLDRWIQMKMTTSIVTNFFMTNNPIQLLLLQTTLLQKLWCITYTTEPIAGWATVWDRTWTRWRLGKVFRDC